MKFIATLALLPLICPVATALVVNSLIPPIEGYTIWEPEWEVEVAPNTTIVARGTIEQVRTQLSKINPRWEADNKAKREAATADVVELTKRTDFVTDGRVDCGGRWERTRWERIHDGIEYLRSVPGQPTNGPGPGACGRVSCSYGGAIWWCNDNTTPKTLAGYGSIADGAQAIMDKCRYYEVGGRYWVSGQAFHKTGWNVIVRHDNNNC
ncbi:hypothetical protein BDV19DRAFT_282662 [Aspergillus venezuelensis]